MLRNQDNCAAFILSVQSYVECRYVFGVTHVPRLEDWPVMPVEHIGFNLVVSSASPQLNK